MRGFSNFIVLPMLRRLEDKFPAVCQRRKECHGGFTLVELLVVMGVVAILATVGVQAYGYFIDRARNTRAIAEIRSMEKEIMLFFDSNERWPDTLAELERGGMSDPWKNQYRYTNFQIIPQPEDEWRTKGNKGKGKGKGGPLNSDYDLYSVGKDGQSEQSITEDSSKDDIVRGDDGNYVGLASQY